MLRIFQSGLLQLSPNSKFARTYFKGWQNFPHFVFFTIVENGTKLAVPDESTLFLKKKKSPPPILILDSDVPSRAETGVFAAVRVIRCGCGGQLPTPVFSES